MKYKNLHTSNKFQRWFLSMIATEAIYVFGLTVVHHYLHVLMSTLHQRSADWRWVLACVILQIKRVKIMLME